MALLAALGRVTGAVENFFDETYFAAVEGVKANSLVVAVYSGDLLGVGCKESYIIRWAGILQTLKVDIVAAKCHSHRLKANKPIPQRRKEPARFRLTSHLGFLGTALRGRHLARIDKVAT
jgi:hypothetical protein